MLVFGMCHSAYFFVRHCSWTILLDFDSGVLLILDGKEGGVVYEELIPEYLDAVRTVSEGKLCSLDK